MVLAKPEHLPQNLNTSRAGGCQAEDNLDRRGFTGAVWSQKTMHTALSNRKIDSRQSSVVGK